MQREQDLEDIINSVGAGRRTLTEQRQRPNETASRLLARWWVAERMAPTLLQYQEELLDEVMEQVRQMVTWIEENSLLLQQETEGAGSIAPSDIKIRLLVVETELERAKFIARNYLRARLAKIDRFLPYFTERDPGLLSENELDYARRHAALLKELYNRSFLDSLPEDMGDLDDETGNVSMIDEPDLDKPVAIRVISDSAGAVQAGPDTVELHKTGIYMLRFSAIAALIGTDVEMV